MEVFWNLRQLCELSAEFVFVVPVSSTLDFLSLRLRWVFLSSASTAGAFAELGFCCAWAPPRGGRAEVVSARLNLRNGTIFLTTLQRRYFDYIHFMEEDKEAYSSSFPKVIQLADDEAEIQTQTSGIRVKIQGVELVGYQGINGLRTLVGMGKERGGIREGLHCPEEK